MRINVVGKDGLKKRTEGRRNERKEMNDFLKVNVVGEGSLNKTEEGREEKKGKCSENLFMTHMVRDESLNMTEGGRERRRERERKVSSG